jgi:predicted enzyme related to lactoylglutathione lyase
MIFAKDMARMTAFYRDALGLRPLPEASSEGWTVFDAGGARLALHAIPAAIAATIDISVPPEARGDSAIKLVFETDELEAVCGRVGAMGGQVLEARRSGSRDCLDPEGNVVQLKAG